MCSTSVSSIHRETLGELASQHGHTQSISRWQSDGNLTHVKQTLCWWGEGLMKNFHAQSHPLYVYALQVISLLYLVLLDSSLLPSTLTDQLP